MSRPPVATGPLAARTAAAAADILALIARDAHAPAMAAQATALASRLLRLAETDQQAFAAAQAALANLATNPDPKRDFALGQILDAAAAAPLAIAEASADVGVLGRSLVEAVEGPHAADAEAAARLADGAGRAAAHLVEVNLGVLAGDERLIRAQTATEPR